MKGDGAPILDGALREVELDSSVQPDTHFAMHSILCGDGPEYDGQSDESIGQETFEAFVEAGWTTAPHFGPATVNIGLCYLWSKYVHSKDRFTGPFNHELSNVILVIGNAADVGSTMHPFQTR